MSRPQHHYVSSRPLFDQGHYLSDSLLGWRLYPNEKIFDESRKSVLFKTDRYGFRNTHSELPKSGKAILLGDSFVQGYYLSEEETIRSQLQKKWDAYIYNFGIGGFSTDQEFSVGRAALKKFKADWIVLFFYNNDLPYLREREAWKKLKSRFVISAGRVDFNQVLSRPFAEYNGDVFPETSVSPGRLRVKSDASYEPRNWELFKMLLGREARLLYVWALGRVGDRVNGSELELEHQRGLRAYQDPAALSDDWDLAFQFFNELRRLAAQQGTQLLLFHIPEMAQIRAGERYFAPQAEFQRRCLSARLHCLEPHSIYAEKAKTEALYFTDDGHFSPKGAALAADLVSQYIQGNQVVSIH